MMTNNLADIKDFLHAQFCYQLFITPMPLPVPKPYRNLARRACEFLENKRSELLHFESPRHHVIHRFAQLKNPNAKKVLLAHGWMSRAAHMARLIRALHKQGYDVYALDFPAHGDAKGAQLPWTDAVAILQQIINQLGPFYAVIGHSFGGSMLLNTLTLANQYQEFKLNSEPDRVILLASPTRMRVPVALVARQLKLNAKALLILRDLFRQQTFVDLKRLHFRHYVAQAQTPFLCVHGQDDLAITPEESIIFCQQYPYASLSLIPGLDHVGILVDERVEQAVCKFLSV